MNELWVKDVERRLTAVETRQAVDTASKEYMTEQFAELKKDFKSFQDSVNAAVWKGILLVSAPVVGAVIMWIAKGGLTAGGVN